MKKDTIMKLLKEHGNKLYDHEKFAKWFMTRFPDESDRIHSYCAEWIQRFNGGNPVAYMDLQSQGIYNEIFGGV